MSISRMNGICTMVDVGEVGEFWECGEGKKKSKQGVGGGPSFGPVCPKTWGPAKSCHTHRRVLPTCLKPCLAISLIISWAAPEEGGTGIHEDNFRVK